MTDAAEIRILLPTDADQILNYARRKLGAEIKDPMELEMAAWTARWRAEALAHYLPQGWSFGAFAADQTLTGYLLGQPLLFYRGLTQTLWVEDLGFDDVAVAKALMDVAYRWARDKHLQCVLLESQSDLQFILHEFKNVHRAEAPLVEVRSAKF